MFGFIYTITTAPRFLILLIPMLLLIKNTDGLAAGTYYVRINSFYTTDFAPYTLKDSLFSPSQANDTEPNDSRATALTLNPNSKTTGHTGYYYNNKRDSSDWYKITTAQDGQLKLCTHTCKWRICMDIPL
jgi:hypothetical protein